MTYPFAALLSCELCQKEMLKLTGLDSLVESVDRNGGSHCSRRPVSFSGDPRQVGKAPKVASRHS